MPFTVADRRAPGQLDRLDAVRPRPAKALNRIEIDDWRERIGRAVRRCFALAGLSQKEAAGKLERDEAQVARWCSGEERAQLDTIFAVEALRGPLVVALSELAGEQVEIETVVRIRRTA